jgi:predicted dehydrogenase
MSMPLVKSAGESAVGIAVIGCESFAQVHLNGWQRLAQAGQVRLEVACSRDCARAQAAAECYGVSSVMTSLEEAVRRPEVQAVDNCLPHHMHLPAVLAAASAGRHVLCEEPLTAGDCKAL